MRLSALTPRASPLLPNSNYLSLHADAGFSHRSCPGSSSVRLIANCSSCILCERFPASDLGTHETFPAVSRFHGIVFSYHSRRPTAKFHTSYASLATSAPPLPNLLAHRLLHTIPARKRRRAMRLPNLESVLADRTYHGLHRRKRQLCPDSFTSPA